MSSQDWLRNGTVLPEHSLSKMLDKACCNSPQQNFERSQSPPKSQVGVASVVGDANLDVSLRRWPAFGFDTHAAAAAVVLVVGLIGHTDCSGFADEGGILVAGSSFARILEMDVAIGREDIEVGLSAVDITGLCSEMDLLTA